MLWRDASIAACVLPPRPGFINVSAVKNGRISELYEGFKPLTEAKQWVHSIRGGVEADFKH